jgi:hypothetical protein
VAGDGGRPVIEVEEYDPAWPARAAAARTVLASRLPGLFAAIEHIGSTSVPGLAGRHGVRRAELRVKGGHWGRHADASF